jgi:uncharacterized protein involved in exopolysaccharide biosynthesis
LLPPQDDDEGSQSCVEGVAELNNARAPAEGSDPDLDLRTLFWLIWRRKLLVVGVVLSTVGAALLGSLFMTPVFRASTIAVPAEVDSGGLGSLGSALSQFGGLAALAGLELGSGGSTIEETLAVLRSREFTEGFIREEGLLPILFEETRFGRGDEPTLAKAYRFFDRDIRAVARDARSGLVTVQIEWRDPILAADWANKLVGRLNAEMRARAIAKTNAAVGFLEKELLATTIVDTRTAIGRLMEAQINQRMLANVTEEYALRVVDKAMPPDDDDPIRPRRLFLAVVSGAVGFLVAVLLCVMLRRPS